MTTSVIDALRREGLVIDTIGVPTKQTLPALVVWARKEPKYEFRALVALARTLSPEPPVVFVDDTCSRVITERSSTQQESLNGRYVDFFMGQGCEVRLSSSIYDALFGSDKMSAIMEIGMKIPLAEFIRCLPEKKRLGLTELHLGETLHALFELLLFEHVSKERNLLVIGQFSQAIVSTHRNVSDSPLAAVVVPRFNSHHEVDAYVAALENL